MTSHRLIFAGCRLVLLMFSFAMCSFVRGDEAKVQKNIIDCSFPKDYQQNHPTNLTALQELAMKAGKETCKTLISLRLDDSSIRDEMLVHFSSQAKSEFDKMFPDSIFEEISSLSEAWSKKIANHQKDYRNFTLIQSRRGCPSAIGVISCWELKLPADNWGQYKYDTTSIREDHCAQTVEKSGIPNPDGSDCAYAFELWESAVAPFQYHYNEKILKDDGKKLMSLQNQWTSFIDDARYQTPLDVWATTKWHDEYFTRDHLSGPPPSQLFLLHPTLVYEHLPDAEKGSKEDISLAVEWGGVNWWRKGFGFSLASVYNDRKNESSVGHGAMLHVKNKYSFGFIKRSDGSDSVFINIDLMELFGDKKEKFEKYKKYF